MHFHNKITQFAVGAAFVLAILGVQYKFLTEGATLGNVMVCLAVLLPVLFAAMLSAVGVWIGILLGVLNIDLSFPVPVLNRVGPGLLLTLLFTGVAMLRWLKGELKFTAYRTLGERCLLLMAVGIILRVIWDRPESANLGGSGGAGEAIFYLAGCFAFVVASGAFPENWNVLKNIKIILALLLFEVFRGAIVALVDERWRCVSFEQPVWLLSAIGLAWFYEHWDRRAPLRTWALYGGLISMMLALAVTSPFRSRPVFALVEILVVALAYRQLKKGVISLVLVVSLGVGMVVLFSPSGVPQIAKRALSTVVSVSRDEASYLSRDLDMSGEFGWQSEFRATLTRLAWSSIREHPLAGKGFAFSSEELANANSMLRVEGLGTGQMTLAVSGIYHNCVLTLAVFCGLPVAALFVIGFGCIFFRFLMRMMRIGPPEWRMFGVSVLAFATVVLGQMLMNGSGPTFLLFCACLGVMNGMTKRTEAGQGACKMVPKESIQEKQI